MADHDSRVSLETLTFKHVKGERTDGYARALAECPGVQTVVTLDAKRKGEERFVYRGSVATTDPLGFFAFLVEWDWTFTVSVRLERFGSSGRLRYCSVENWFPPDVD